MNGATEGHTTLLSVPVTLRSPGEKCRSPISERWLRTLRRPAEEMILSDPACL